VILGLCLLLRSGVVLDVLESNPREVVQVDSRSYLRPALALLDDAHFFQSPNDRQPEFVRTPGYPAFIALVYLIFGESHAALLLMQVLVSTCTVLVVYLLGARMWSVPVGLLAAAMAVVEPLQWYSAGTILTETLATLLLTLVAAAGFIVFAQEKPELRWPLLLGVATAMVTMVRPVTYYLPLFVIALLAYRTLRRQVTLCQGVQMIAVFLLPLVLIVGGWQLRNHETVQSWRFSAVEAKNLDLFRAAGIVADDEGIGLNAAQQRLITRLSAVRGESQGAYYERMYQQGLQIVTSNPFEAVKGAAEGLFHEVTSTRSRVFTYLGLRPASGALEDGATVVLAAFYGLFVYGLVQVARARRDRLAHLFVVGTAAYVLFVSAGPEAAGGRGERFRSVIMPILILYAARGTQQLFVRVRLHRDELIAEATDQAASGR
jgi:Dolichyl-phosphate-mannose-protein mannosyltransferase